MKQFEINRKLIYALFELLPNFKMILQLLKMYSILVILISFPFSSEQFITKIFKLQLFFCIL